MSDRLSIRFERPNDLDRKSLSFCQAVQAAQAGFEIEVLIEEEERSEVEERVLAASKLLQAAGTIEMSPEGMKRFKERMQKDFKSAEEQGKLADRTCKLEDELLRQVDLKKGNETYTGDVSFDNLVYYAMGRLAGGEKDYNVVLDMNGRFGIDAGWAMEAVRQAKEPSKKIKEGESSET